MGLFVSGCSLFFSCRLDLNFRRFVRLRSNKLCDAAASPAAAKDEEGEAEDEQTEERRQEEGGQMDADDCHVCPGTEAPPPLFLT